ncbi:MAG: hypothetical protein JW825_04175 [Candidatus Methanofastidiosa archaeon]|nr:hypothetical protein [Candidatus Methanofastidiosa archaeon]
MENTEEIIKEQIEIIQNQINEIKSGFNEITGSVSTLDNTSPELGMLNNLLSSFSKLILLVEEVGKKSATLFINKNIYNDSSELTKYLHQSKLKMESIKESYLAKDRTGYYKHISSLSRSLDSTEYILSLFLGELTSEITKIIFKQYIEKKSVNDFQNDIAKIAQNIEAIRERTEKCEKRISLLMRNNPQAFMEGEEAKVLNEIMRIHSQNVQWVEPRFIEKELPISNRRIDEILEDFLRYGILECKLRGGMKVYKYMSGEQDDINTD